MLPLRNQPIGNKSYIEFLEEVKENTLYALDNQDYQFEELVEKLNLKREPGRNPLIDAVLVVLEGGGGAAGAGDRSEGVAGIDKANEEKPEIRVIPEQSLGVTAKFDLEIQVAETGNKIVVSLSYAVSLFKRDTALKILKLYFDILRQVLEDENILLKDINVTTDFLKAQSKISKNIDFNF
jgi:non-ribosomal peptide synthetase component F